MDVFPHITQRLEKRICIRFDQRPEASLLCVLKHHGNHRPIGSGQRAWQFASDSWRVLVSDLNRQGYPEVAKQLRGVVRQWRDSNRAQQRGHIESDEEVEEEGGSSESEL